MSSLKKDTLLDLFYKHKTVLITGGNGFMGKALVETLLRCFEVERIYLLIRSKKNENSDNRLKEMLNDKLFDRIRESEPKKLLKLKAIATNYDADDIISEENLGNILNEVSIVFNIVASVKFYAPIHELVQSNMLYTQKIVKIANNIRNLKSFIHTSTIYSNCNQNFAEEIIYDHPITYQQLIAVADDLKHSKDPSKLPFKNDFPNNYALSKHFAEKLVNDQADKIATGIFRPPVVISNYKSFPGWTDNFYGFTGVVATLGKGLSKCWIGVKDVALDIAPIDYCTNAMIATAWDVAEKFKKAQDNQEKFSIPIYNYKIKEKNILTVDAVKLIPEGYAYPFNDMNHNRTFIRTSSKFIFLLLNFILSAVPAFFKEHFATWRGQKVNYIKKSQNSKIFHLAVGFFMSTKFNFDTKNVIALTEKVKNMENYRDELDFDMMNIDWKDFFKKFYPGIRKYLFKEDINLDVGEQYRGNLYKKMSDKIY